ncbi:MAG TPA: DUF885 domain-containing protein, partial [Allosphingosinicella sp.]|nr:DUF885 domain-containing protein [Allosphingosinicella sp.]
MKHVPLLFAAAALAACAQTPPAEAVAAPASDPAEAAAPAQDHSQALAALFAESDEVSLRRNPVQALFRGDLRYADRLGHFLSDEYFASERGAAQSELAALARIDRAALSPSERISYDVFKWQRELDLEGLQVDMLALTAVRPIDHFNGFHAFFAELSSGESVAPYKTLKDYENGLSRIDDFVVNLEQAIVRMRQGMATGVVQPRLVMANVVEQLDAMLAEGVAGSTFMKPLNSFPADISAADQARLKAAYAQSIETEIRPALTRLRAFIVTDYLPKTRASVGLRDMPGGDRLYAYLVEASTTTDLSPDQIHRIGLDEVKRLHGEMEAVKDQVGFKGTLQQFFE